ncbi:MAG: ATP-binding protein [Povalibacter sp.]
MTSRSRAIHGLRVRTGLLQLNEEAAAVRRGLLNQETANIDDIPEPWVAWTAHGIIEYWDDAAMRVYGYTLDEALNRNVGALLQVQWPMPFDELISTLRSEGSWSGEVRSRARDGHVLTVESKIKRFFDGQRELFVECTRNIAKAKTGRLHLERAMLDATDHFVHYDPSWRFSYLNNAAAKHFGKRADELLGRCIWEIFPEWIGGEYYTQLHKAATERIEIHVERHCEAQGIWVDEHIYPSLSGVTVLAIDISARKQTERDRQSHIDEIIAVAAHEMRGPLAPVRAGVSILKTLNDPTPTLKKTIEILDRQTLYISRLVDDLLDATRIKHGKFELRRSAHDLTEVVGAVVEDTRSELERAGLRVEWDACAEPLMANVDPLRIGQVVRNLLTNAGKYTDAGGSVLIRARASGSHAVIEVQDTGIGITADALTSIFEMFSQVPEQRFRSEGGLGIGLSLVRALVQMHEGTITASSEGSGKGSVFTVKLPLLASDVGTSLES